MAKLTVQLNPEMESVLEVLAGERGLPKTQVLRDAVRLMKYLDDAGRTADLVLRSRTDGSERQLVLESQLRPAVSSPVGTQAGGAGDEDSAPPRLSVSR